MSHPAVLAWPTSRLGEALTALARHTGLTARAESALAPSMALGTGSADGLGQWIEATADWLGCEAEPVETPLSEVEQLAADTGPALLRLPDGAASFLAVVGRGAVLTPELAVVRLSAEEFRDMLRGTMDVADQKSLETLLTDAGLTGRRRQRAHRILQDRLRTGNRVAGGWILRPAEAAPTGAWIWRSGLVRMLVVLLLAHLAASALWLSSWWVIGAMSLHGRAERDWLFAWLLLLATVVPCRLLSTIAGNRLSVQTGILLKRRLLVGALRLDPDEVRHLGVGQLLGRVLDADQVAALAMTGGFLGLTALLELVLAAAILGAGAVGAYHVLLLLLTLLVTGVLTWVYTRRRRQWTEQRLALTDDLVERMVGHRTRVAQQARSRWHTGEDETLEAYVGASTRLDRMSVALEVLVPRGWFVLALLTLAPAFVYGGPPSPALAASVGGIVLAYRALNSLGTSLDQLTAAAIAWERVRLYWQAAERREAVRDPRFAVMPPSSASGREGGSGPLLTARDLVFRYRDRAEPILQGADVEISAGDRLLLEGPSGGGKSTLALVLAGQRTAESGLLLLGGLDQATVGAAGWRRRVVLAPQFHDNRLLIGTFAYNALLGRGWPPRQTDLDETERVCRALGLGPLLDRMPAGLQQMVGETGWQLSHGEKSRLFMARALLQRGDLLILDESFAALDPQTLQATLSYVLELTRTVVVIAHP